MEALQETDALKKPNYTGIPKAVFLEDVEAFMSKQTDVAEALRGLDEQLSKYKFMELNLQHKKQRLASQIPEMKVSLELLSLLETKRDASEDTETRFLLSDEVFAKALVPPTDTVCLWLGANVMLEYTLADARELLSKNLGLAKKNMGEVQHDLDFLRDQITTTEVNMARVHNWKVKQVQAQRATTSS